MGSLCSAVVPPDEQWAYDATTTGMVYVDQFALWEIQQDVSQRGITPKTLDFYQCSTSASIENHGSPLVALPFFVHELSPTDGRKVWLLLRRSEPPENASCVCRGAAVCDTAAYMNFAAEIARRGSMKHYVWVAGSLDG